MPIGCQLGILRLHHIKRLTHRCPAARMLISREVSDDVKNLVLDKKSPMHWKTGQNLGQGIKIVARPSGFKGQTGSVKSVKPIGLATHGRAPLPRGLGVFNGLW